MNTLLDICIHVYTHKTYIYMQSTIHARLQAQYWRERNIIIGHCLVKFKVQPSLASSRGNIGSLDMGGASTQIAFDPGHVAIDPSYKFRLTLYGYTYDIYTHSYLCYGLDEALRRYKATLVQVGWLVWLYACARAHHWWLFSSYCGLFLYVTY